MRPHSLRAGPVFWGQNCRQLLAQEGLACGTSPRACICWDLGAQTGALLPGVCPAHLWEGLCWAGAQRPAPWRTPSQVEPVGFRAPVKCLLQVSPFSSDARFPGQLSELRPSGLERGERPCMTLSSPRPAEPLCSQFIPGDRQMAPDLGYTCRVAAGLAPAPSRHLCWPGLMGSWPCHLPGPPGLSPRRGLWTPAQKISDPAWASHSALPFS